MNEKSPKNGVQQNGEERSGKNFRNQFWTTNLKEDSRTENDMPKRPESSVSRQFLPKKQQGVSEIWKQTQGSREDVNQPFNYTPFKSGSLNRVSSVNALRGGTPQPQQNQNILLSQNIQQQIGNTHSGYVQASYQQPQAYGSSYQIYGIMPNGKDMRPQGQSTPKTTPHFPSRQQSVSNIATSTNGMWRGVNSTITAPPSGAYRPASAMNVPAVTRPSSRAASEIALGVGVGGMGSRYQSYCTLPRPEQADFDFAAEVGHMAQQINMLYGPYNNNNSNKKSFGDTNALFAPPNDPNNQINQSRQQSSVLAGAPGMASDYVIRRPSLVNNEQSILPLTNDEASYKAARDIVNFDGLSLLSAFQVLCAIAIFVCGIFRMIWHAKWAIGVELAYGIIVLVTGGIGMYANCKRSHFLATATFVLSAFNAVLAIIPLVLGLLPTVPSTFPNAQPEWFVSENEYTLVDYVLSFACFVEIILALTVSVYGCKAIGSTMTHVEKLRLNADLNAAFDTASTSIPKSSDIPEKKNNLH